MMELIVLILFFFVLYFFIVYGIPIILLVSATIALVITLSNYIKAFYRNVIKR